MVTGSLAKAGNRGHEVPQGPQHTVLHGPTSLIPSEDAERRASVLVMYPTHFPSHPGTPGHETVLTRSLSGVDGTTNDQAFESW